MLGGVITLLCLSKIKDMLRNDFGESESPYEYNLIKIRVSSYLTIYVLVSIVQIKEHLLMFTYVLVHFQKIRIP